MGLCVKQTRSYNHVCNTHAHCAKGDTLWTTNHMNRDGGFLLQASCPSDLTTWSLSTTQTKTFGRTMNSGNVASSPELVSVPVDHQDPNHPHYPGDLEHQSGFRRSVITEKRVLIAVGVATTVLVMIAAAIWGVALTRKPDDKAAAIPAATMTPDTIISAPIEIHTVSVKATTTVFSTTRLLFLVAPSLATSTIVLAPPRTSDVALRPVGADSIAATSTSTTPVPSEASVGDISITGCLFNGAWVLREQCEKHCPAWDGRESRCEVNKRSQWVCVSCPSKS
jgi:hypothetical protein